MIDPSGAELWDFGHDVLDWWAMSAPDQTALYVLTGRDDCIRHSFAQVADVSNQVGRWLSEHGMRRGDRVLVVLGKDPAFWPIMMGLLKIGAIPMPGTVQLTTGDLWYRLSAAEADSAIVLPETAARIDARAERFLKTTIVVGGSQEGWTRLDPWDLPAGSVPLPRVVAPTDPALIYFTSGTTNYPKMVLHDHRYPFSHHITAGYWIGLQPDDLHWNVADTGWAKAAWSSLFGPWTKGAGIVVDDLTGKFVARDLLDRLAVHPVTSLCAPPTVYRLLVQEPLETLRERPLRSLVAAGEPLNPEVIETVSKATGLTIRDGYGQTETVLLVGNAPGAAVRPGSMGKPAPAFDMAVVDHEGHPLPPGQEGDIAVRFRPVRPPGLFLEYVGEAEGTASRFVGDYYITGDRGIRDEDGYFWFVARADDVIISAGYRIGPFEVESALVEHPAVVEAAVVSSPDPIRGEVVKAFVVLREGVVGDERLVEEVQDHVKSVTAPYKYPRRIEFVTELPKTISGKIRRNELRAREWGSPTPSSATEE